MVIEGIKIGADPELFLEKDGVIISAEGLIGGTKEDPKPISNEGHFIQEDNVMIEFNIPACDNEKDFTKNINYVKDYLELHAMSLGAKLNFSASGLLDKKQLKTKQAKQFGCDPDFNVYLKDVNPKPNARTNMRTCGGHIHIGYKNPDQEVSEQLVKAMDAVLGLQSLFLDPDDRRRKMYGKAGSFRFKEYGVEYRTLSNFWITNDELISWAFNATMTAIELVMSNDILKIDQYSSDIERAINTADRNLAKDLLKKVEQIRTKVTI